MNKRSSEVYRNNTYDPLGNMYDIDEFPAIILDIRGASFLLKSVWSDVAYVALGCVVTRRYLRHYDILKFNSLQEACEYWYKG